MRVLAFYLPQFHPVAENDALVGTGLHRVDQRRAGAAPLSRPLPAASPRRSRLLRSAPARSARRAGRAAARRTASTASATTTTGSAAGGFSSGRSTRCSQLGRARLPVLPLLGQRELDPALGRQGRRGAAAEQHYTEADDRNHLDWLATAFADPRYIRVDGKPLFADVPAPPAARPAAGRPTPGASARTSWAWGELYLCRVEAHPEERGDPTRARLRRRHRIPARLGRPGRNRSGRAAAGHTPGPSGWWTACTSAIASSTTGSWSPACSPRSRLRTAAFRASPPDGTTRRGSRPTRGSSAGRRHASTAAGSAPCWSGSSRSAPGEDLVFVNAWNEWAEGAQPGAGPAVGSCLSGRYTARTGAGPPDRVRGTVNDAR